MSLPAVVLYEPRIPPNTGNIIRLCANTGAPLHLIHPLGFDLAHSDLRRAGLDYHEFARLQEHSSLEEFITTCCPTRILAFSARGRTRHDAIRYASDDALLFGPEPTGLPAAVMAGPTPLTSVRLPMLPQSRSMNLANCVAVVVYEAWRQRDFVGAAPTPRA